MRSRQSWRGGRHRRVGRGCPSGGRWRGRRPSEAPPPGNRRRAKRPSGRTEWAPTRVPELVPIRYGRMAASPFAYFRGAALPMAADLATVPQTGIRVQLCGDAHLSNFGGFASPERDLVFDVNDFDETHPGPFDWDIKRLAASLEIAGRGRGFD